MSRSIRVCHLSPSHSVDDARVFVRECVALAAAGYEVHMIGYGEQTSPFRCQEVFVHPLPKAANRWQRFTRRSRGARIAADLKPDLLHVHDPEMLGTAIAIAGSCPVIWDVHESYLDVVMQREWIPNYLRRGVRRAWDWRERRLVRRCAAVIAVTEPVARRYYALGANVRIIANFPELSEWRDLPVVPRDHSTCVFAGAIDRARGLLEVVQAIGILKQRGLPVRLELAGCDQDSHVVQILQEAARSGVQNQIAYHGSLSRPDTKRLMQAASIGIVTYLPTGNNMAGWPAKLFECMAHCLPLVYSDFPTYREIAETSAAGIAVDPTNPGSIADAIERLVRNPELAIKMGEAGKRAVWDRFNWDREKSKLLSLYEEILGSSHGDALNPP